MDLRILGPFPSCPSYSRCRRRIGSTSSGAKRVQISHRLDPGVETTLLVVYRVEGLVLVPEDSVRRLKLA